jgi:hypothetical protein
VCRPVAVLLYSLAVRAGAHLLLLISLVLTFVYWRPEFDFMFDLDSEEHAYYRWRLYSLAGA